MMKVSGEYGRMAKYVWLKKLNSCWSVSVPAYTVAEEKMSAIHISHQCL